MTSTSHSVFKRLAYATAGIVLLCFCGFFAVTVLHLARSEVLPAIRQGTLSVETKSMILNIVWEGNEIYVLLAAYLLVTVGFGYGVIRALKAAMPGK